jgi:hypothetical protein
MSSKIFCHRARPKRKAAAPRPLTIKPEDPERHRARVALELREAERIQADRRRRMDDRRNSRLAREAELDALEAMAASLLPWDKLWPRWAAVTGAPPGSTFRSPGRRPHTGVAATWARFVIFGEDASIGLRSLDPTRLAMFRSICPVTAEMGLVEPLIEFLTRLMAVSARPGFNAAKFREQARAAARKSTEFRKASRPEWEALDRVVIEDLGDGWIAARLNIDRALDVDRVGP